MKTLYIDCGMGAAGDMLTAALLDLMPDRAAAVSELNALGIPAVQFEAEESVKCGITGLHMRVLVNGEEEAEFRHHHEHGHAHEHVHEDHDHEHEHLDHDHEHDHHHDHDHDHEHEHHHGSMHEVEHIVAHMHTDETVKKDVLAVYQLIADAESQVHNVPVTDIHFHEVGTMDAVADVTAVSYLMHRLNPDRVIASPVHVGAGTVHCAHGILPVPAPATALILKDIPIYGGAILSELCTPTGAALLKYFVSSFGNMPLLRPERTGYGMGKKDFERANCVRMILGTEDGSRDEIVELACNLDDMTAEEIGFAMDRLYEAGAREVFTTPCGMKKNRPGTLLTVLTDETHEEAIVSCLFKHTTTIGIRRAVKTRYTMNRETVTVDTPFGPVRKKISSGFGTETVKYEYDDLQQIAEARDLSLREVREKL